VLTVLDPQWDLSDISGLQQHVSEILAEYPILDTIFINAGIQRSFSLLDPKTTSLESISSEINVNLTVPALLMHLFVPHLVKIASAGSPANLLVTSLTLAYFPFPFYPAYCASEAGIHGFCVTLREQLSFAPDTIQQNLNVVEVVPPYTDTELDSEHRSTITAIQGENALTPMPLADYISEAYTSLNELDQEGQMKKEIGVGFAQTAVEMWKGSFGASIESMGIRC
jgi:short-subunit dehydrogenase involved in D-alanine esterification of teichoic acids